MSDIGKGDWVECIETDGSGRADPGCYEVGGIYRVSDVHIYLGEEQLNCDGRIRPKDFGLLDLGWDAASFRPIRSDITEIQRLLEQPLPAELVNEQTS